jgi:hydroxypyruvate reductase
MNEMRTRLLDFLAASIAAVVPEQSVRERLESEQYGAAGCAVIAVGKAATVMMKGALAALGDAARDALVISAPAYAGSVPEGVRFVPGNHPVPDTTSLEAGAALLDFVKAQPGDRKLVFLISGGASAMVEALEPHVTPEQLQQATRWMLGSGLDIRQTNLVRKCLSAIKGGKLLRYFDNPALALLVSDVPGDNPADIGSGLLSPDSAIADVGSLQLPAWLRALVRVPELPARQDEVRVEIIASNGIAKEAAAAAARQAGLPAVLHAGFLSGETGEVATGIAAYLLDEASAGIHVWGGETSVMLPENPGTGGRNQQLALQVAQQIAGNDGLCFLSAGTDGIDGFSEDAGAIVDGRTIERGEHEGLDAAVSLARADANPFLAASGDLIHLGATGTNVMDIMLAWKSGA